MKSKNIIKIKIKIESQSTSLTGFDLGLPLFKVRLFRLIRDKSPILLIIFLKKKIAKK